MEDENKEDVKEKETGQEVIENNDEEKGLTNDELNQKVKESKYDWASLTPIIVFGVILVGLVIALLVIIYA